VFSSIKIFSKGFSELDEKLSSVIFEVHFLISYTVDGEEWTFSMTVFHQSAMSEVTSINNYLREEND